MSTGSLQKYAAFTSDPNGGNPAGVWIGDALPEAAVMQRIAADVGFSETAFVAPAAGRDRIVRYFSPAREVPFCGHATIATGVAMASEEGDGVYQLETTVGRVPVSVHTTGGQREAALTSVEPSHSAASEQLVSDALSSLDWCAADLDPAIPPARAYAGAWHLVLAVNSRARLDSLEYDFDRLKTIMLREDLVTLQLVWRQQADVFHSRNPFPVGGIVEDPATGAAAAALGGYLRDAKLLEAPATISIRQGEVMGRPSLLRVEIPEAGGIIVRGAAVPLQGEYPVSDLEIRESVEGDRAGIESLYPKAFPAEDLVPLVRDLLNDPVIATSLVATLDQTIAGHAVFTRCDVAGSHIDVALLGPLAVTPALQRQGVGSALMRDGLQRMRAHGVRLVCLLGDPDYYRRFGFETERSIEPPYPLPAEWIDAWQSMWLAHRDATPSGKLVVPAPWRDQALWAP